MASAFEDPSLGLKLRGYHLVPNGLLEMKIAIYTPQIVETILSEHPEVVDRWLQTIHGEYIAKKKACDFDNDPVACFVLSDYEDFERHFKSWEDGGIIAISLPHETIRISKKPLITITVDSKSQIVCSKCQALFASLEEFEKHTHVEKPAKPKEVLKDEYVLHDPVHWIT